jgi:arginyl-tRNA--protein-N-Asp/Glu arginylyltransferase
MLIEPQTNARHFYPLLLENGFRRSGEQVYRPHCPDCQACQSLRIPVKLFKTSRSQKRLVNKNRQFRIALSNTPKDEYFNLYQDYINQIHPDGSMFPPSSKQYDEFFKSSWNNPLFIEIYDQDKLISVSVTDQLSHQGVKTWSAFYCFYAPDYRAYSLGKYAVLTQLRLAKEFNIDWLYLGYYIENCRKMNYKTQFNPHQRLINNSWVRFNYPLGKALT